MEKYGRAVGNKYRKQQGQRGYQEAGGAEGRVQGHRDLAAPDGRQAHGHHPQQECEKVFPVKEPEIREGE